MFVFTTGSAALVHQSSLMMKGISHSKSCVEQLPLAKFSQAVTAIAYADR